MSETAEMLRETAARAFAPHCEPGALREAETAGPSEAAWASLADAGLHRALLSEAAGGYGVPVADALSLLRVAGAQALPLPLAETMLAGWLLAGAGLAVPDGMLTVAPVVAGERLMLEREGGGWRLSGRASRIPWGRNADAAAVLAFDGERPMVALVPAGAWEATPDQNLAVEPRDTLTFAASLASAAVAPARPEAVHLRAVGAAMRAMQISGAMTRIAEITVAYAQERVQFGRPIGKFQAIQQNLAVLAGQTAAACAAADLGAEAVSEGVRLLPIAAAKARAGEAAGIGAAIAHQVHGAIGFTYEHRLHFSTKRLWSWRDEFGHEAEWQRLIGRHMARAGADRLWAEITAA
jgi:acyl-CoA dehydrogenase